VLKSQVPKKIVSEGDNTEPGQRPVKKKITSASLSRLGGIVARKREDKGGLTHGGKKMYSNYSLGSEREQGRRKMQNTKKT